MGFNHLTDWYDRLTEPARQEVIARRRQVGTPGKLLPPGHGHRLPEQLEHAAAIFRKTPTPFSLIRLGDSELALLGAGYFPSHNPRTLDFLLFRAGLDREAISLRPEFIRTYSESTLIGLQQNWPPVRTNSAVLLSMLGFQIPYPKGVEVHLPYKLLANGDLFRFLQRRRILLVGHLAPRLKRAWQDPSFLAAYAHLGPIRNARIIGALDIGNRGQGAWRKLGQLTQAILREKPDVVLLAAGAIAKILALRLLKHGITALDVGYIFDALLGVSPQERRARPVLGGIRWPPRSW